LFFSLSYVFVFPYTHSNDKYDLDSFKCFGKYNNTIRLRRQESLTPISFEETISL